MVLNCEACTIENKVEGGQVPCYIPPSTQFNVLFVGQAPGKTEVLTGRPFTGSAGKMLYALMKGAGLNKLNIPQTNICLCKPPDDGKGNDRAPTAHEATCCQNHLVEELAWLHPELVVGFGGFTCQQLTGERDLSITSIRGTFLKLDPKWEYDCPVLCCLHPSFVMRQRQWIPVAVNDLTQVIRFFTEGIPKEDKYNFLYEPTCEELEAYLYSSDDIVDVDTETTGLNKRLDKVIGISFSNSPFSAVALDFASHDPRLVIIKNFLEDPTRRKSMQNGSFDTEILLSTFGINVQGFIYDTRLGEQLLSSDTPKDLDHLRSVYTRIKGYKPSKQQKSQIAFWGKEKRLEYAAWDAVVTGQVRRAQAKLLSEKQEQLMQELLIPLVPAINRMERVGVKVDVPVLAMIYADLVPKADKLYEEIASSMEVNPNSPSQIKEAFGLKKTDREELEYHIQRGHPKSELLQKILDYRDLSKGASTFLKGVYSRLEEGYIHTDYKIEGTGTGRLSSSNPNLQNIQEPYRVIFIPEEGNYFLSGDYKQLELWVGAIIAPCPELLKDLQSGIDVHSAVLEEMRPYMPQRLLTTPKTARLAAKTVVFGTFYGRSPRSIAVTFGVTVEEASRWQQICFGRYEGLKKYVLKQQAQFSRYGYIDTPWGRRRYLTSVTQAFNAPVQSSASDVTLSTIVELHRLGFDLRLTVHDSIVIQVPKENLHESYTKIKRVFERPIPQLDNTSFRATFDYGENWYNMQSIDEHIN